MHTHSCMCVIHLHMLYASYPKIYMHNICCIIVILFLLIVAGDAMKLSSYRPPATQQNYSGSYDRSSDRLAPSSNDTTVDRSRTAVSGGDGNHSGLSQHLVKFVWYPNDPFKVHESKATLLSSFTVSSCVLFVCVNILHNSNVIFGTAQG